MRVMVMMRVPSVHRNHAPRIRNRAAHMLELDGRVVDMKTITQHMLNLMQNPVTL